MKFTDIIDLKTKFDLSNDQPPEKLFIARSDENSLMTNLHDDEEVVSLEIRVAIREYGMKEVKKFLEEKLNIEVILDYTDPKGSHFE